MTREGPTRLLDTNRDLANRLRLRVVGQKPHGSFVSCPLWNRLRLSNVGTTQSRMANHAEDVRKFTLPTYCCPSRRTVSDAVGEGLLASFNDYLGNATLRLPLPSDLGGFSGRARGRG